MIDMKKLTKLFDKLFFGFFGYSYPKEDYLKKIEESKVEKPLEVKEPVVETHPEPQIIPVEIKQKPKRKRSPRKKKTQATVL